MFSYSDAIRILSHSLNLGVLRQRVHRLFGAAPAHLDMMYVGGESKAYIQAAALAIQQIGE